LLSALSFFQTPLCSLYYSFQTPLSENTQDLINYELDIEKWENHIKNIFPNTYKRIFEEYKELLRDINNKEKRALIINKLEENKDYISKIIKETLNHREKIIEGYKKINFSTNALDWGITTEDMKEALKNGCFIRNRFTILSFLWYLGVLERFV